MALVLGSAVGLINFMPTNDVAKWLAHCASNNYLPKGFAEIFRSK